MSDHEFEKKVQQRMDELRLRPSDAVWTEVEKNLRRDKRRRRVLLWIPMLGLLLTAGGYFIFTGTNSSSEGKLVNTQATEKNVAGKKAAPTTSSNSEPASAPTSTSKHPASTQNNQPSSETSTQSNTREQVKKDNESEKNTESVTVRRQENEKKYNVLEKEKKNNVTERTREKRNRNEQLLTRTKERQTQPEVKPEKNKADLPKEEAVVNKLPVISKDSAKTQIDSNAIVNNSVETENNEPVQQKIDSAEKLIAKPDSANTKQAIAKAPAKKKQSSASKFQWGVTAGAGFSNISEGSLFNLLNSARVESFMDASPQYNGFPPTPTPEPSPIETGAVLSVGGYVQTKLSKRINLSVGLQYSYWTVSTKIGRRVDSVLAINFNAQFAQLASGYYRADMGLRDYTNRYHFIEIPVTTSFQLNRSKTTPLVFDAGVSFARLINTNALHFDAINRVYYENDDFFNRLQVGLNTGINVGFLQKSKNPVWVGPNLRYFATGLLKDELSPTGAQHIWSFGINAKMLLKK